jgi:hypothetical protein
MKMNKETKQVRIAADQQLMKGLTTKMGGTAALTISGKQVTVAAIVAVLQERVDAALAATAARNALTATASADRQKVAETRQLVDAVRTAVRVMVGPAADVLGEFGLAPKKSRAPTVATKADALVKATATRKARGTVGKRAKLKIKGTVGPENPTPPKTQASATTESPSAQPTQSAPATRG